MRIDCERCPAREGGNRCEGCLVSFVLELEDGAVVLDGEVDEEGNLPLDPDTARAVRALADAGLLGSVRRIPREEAS